MSRCKSLSDAFSYLANVTEETASAFLKFKTTYTWYKLGDVRRRKTTPIRRCLTKKLRTVKK